jgi:hypothetical protein
MLSTDLTELYDVEARALVQAVKRNLERFPGDFMCQLSLEEFRNLKSQIVTSSGGLSVPHLMNCREYLAAYRVSYSNAQV